MNFDLIFFSECYTCAKPTFVKLIWGTIHIYQRLKYIGSCSKMIKRGRLLKQGESRVTAQEIYLKVSPARLLSFLELFNKEKENQKLERFWKISEREKKNTLVFQILILNDSLDNNLASVHDDYKRVSQEMFFPNCGLSPAGNQAPHSRLLICSPAGLGKESQG